MNISVQYSRIWHETHAFSSDSIKFDASNISHTKRQVSQFITQTPSFSPALSLTIQKKKSLYNSPTSNTTGPNLQEIIHNFLELCNVASMNQPRGSKSKTKMAMKHVILSFSLAESSNDSRIEDHDQPGLQSQRS